MWERIKKLFGIKEKEKEVKPNDDSVVFIPEEKEEKKSPPWYVAGLKWKGKKETDPELKKHLVPFWKRIGLRIDTLSGSAAAWCGLAAASTLLVVGLSVPQNSFRAKDWDNFGVAVNYQENGIPQGAFVRLNHGGDCKSTKGNHVSQANGDCAPGDIVEMKKDVNGVYQSTGKFKKGATIDLLGGNQADTWKVTTYSVTEICAVRWPAEHSPPPKITKSINCTSGKSGSESTR